MIRTFRARNRESSRSSFRTAAWFATWIVLISAGDHGLPCGVGAERSDDKVAPVWNNPTAMIDAMIADRWRQESIEPSELCNDATFIRRASLDLIGRVPTPSERAAFMADPSPDKRDRLIDQLLESPLYARHMADVFDALLVGRRANEPSGRRRREASTRQAESDWRQYLQDSFATNRPWNQIARDLVLARATDETDVRATWFLYQRRDSHQDIAEAIAPALFGIRIECAQCHDHPLASEIEQAHYWGLVAFFSRGRNQQTDQGLRVSETADGGTQQYTDLAGESHQTRLTFFASQVVNEPTGLADAASSDSSQTVIADAAISEAHEPPVPRVSRRQLFADQILAEHPLLARSLVNRIWALLIGRGFVHPHDRMDSTHPASHPELLEALADDVRASNYDIQRLIRQIVRSRVYQLDSRPADAEALPEHFAFGLTKLLPAESLLRSMFVVLHADAHEPEADLMREFCRAFPDVLPEEPISNLSQALLLTNNAQLNRWFDTANSPVLAELAVRPTDVAKVDGAFQAALGRDPDADERNAAVAFVQSHSESNKGLVQLMWALLMSTEFRMNH